VSEQPRRGDAGAPGRPARLLARFAPAWRLREVRRGFAGSLLIALGALTPSYLPRSSPFWKLYGNNQSLATSLPVAMAGTALTMAGLLLLVDAWFRLRPPDPAGSHQSTRTGGPGMPAVHYGAVFVIWAAPLLVAPPIFSHDAYAYAAQGWLLHNRINPYDVGPGYLPGAFADQVDWLWRMTPSPYGPLSLTINQILVVACGFRPYLAAWAMRLPALLGVVLIVALMPRIARRMGADVGFTWWFALLNPVLIISFLGGAHNDALMVGLVVLGLWCAFWPGPARWPRLSGWWWLAGAVVIGVAASIKQPALLAAYVLPLIVRPWATWQRRDVLITAGRVAASLVVAVGTFLGVSFATGLDLGWLGSVVVPGRAMSLAPSRLLGAGLQWVADRLAPGPSHAAVVGVTETVVAVIGVLIIGVLALTVARRKPLTFLVWGYLVTALAGPALRSWYVQWCVTLAPLADIGRRTIRIAVWGTLVMLGFDAVSVAWTNSAVSVGVAAMVAFAWLAWTHDPWVRPHRFHRASTGVPA